MEFQKDELNEILNIFQQESAEIISSMDEKLLILERDPENSNMAMQLFRDAHSLKGSARMLGFESMQDVLHKIEDVIGLVKENKLRLTSGITDFISECLTYVMGLINKTVEQKEEYIDPKTAEYIEKLIKIATDNKEEFSVSSPEEEENPEKKSFLEHFEEMENLIVDMLLIVTKAREEKNFDSIFEIEKKIQDFIFSIENSSSNILSSIKYSATNILNSLDKYKNAQNKEYAFLEINNSITIFVENIRNYTTKEKIKTKEYYDIVDNKIKDLDNETKASVQVREDVPEVTSKEDEKLTETICKLPLLEINVSFTDEVLDNISGLIKNETNPEIKQNYIDSYNIISMYKQSNTIVNRDVCAIVKEVFEAIKSKNKDKLQEAEEKFNAIKKMAVFQQKNIDKKPAEKSDVIKNQKEILNTITNTEIKTLRIDSVKLDNLVGEIGELIVSKIKTNEQLSLAKRINSALTEWQKNFAKMGYYIKYFDKKYLSNQEIQNTDEHRKILAYNKQLCLLIEQHNNGISNISKDLSNLFKQLQESETKLNATTREIETMVKNMRILPLSTIFQLFPRMVHNIAKEKGKKIELVIKNQDISADKTIIEELKIPLMHIIRNSIDHGIEDIETRKALSKNSTGRIEISASYKDNNIVIDIKDDGRGLDIEKIKKKALEKKILTPDEINAIDDNELTNLIFYPGFSTEDFVTEISGRGLGLDIVNNKINDMQGRIDIFSELNRGTLVRITLPSTVATKKVFVIEENEQLWAIETSVIKTILRINTDDIYEKDNHNYFIYNGEAISIYTLCQILNFENKPRHTNKYTLLVIETDNNLFGIIVEKLISDQEIVHKKISPPLYRIKNISGITTLANGEACLIINMSDVINTIGAKKIKTKIITQNEISKAKNNSKYNILIVDDSYTTRILQQNILSRCGYNVQSATNPTHALEKIEKEQFDVIVSDVQMPVMNGFEFIKILRKNPNYEKIPVIIMSSEPMEKYTKEIKETKIIKYIPKNLFKQDELIKCVESVLV